MDMIPERKISATYAPELIPNVSTATSTLFVLLAKKTKNIKRSCTMVGVPRITVRYKRQTAFRIFKIKPGRPDNPFFPI